MRTQVSLWTLALLLAAGLGCFGMHARDHAEAATRPQTPQAQTNPASSAQTDLPQAEYGPSFEYLAWSLFLQIMSPTDGAPTFESWTEQCQLNPAIVGCPAATSSLATGGAAPARKVRLLHASIGFRTRLVPGSPCGGMVTSPIEGYPAPGNLAHNATFCEEIYVSPAEAAFARRYLLTLAEQQQYGTTHSGAINFPGTEQNEARLDLDSVEVKVDWVPNTSFRGPSFTCPDPAHKLYTETINGTCYAMAAVHISSKVMPNWLWATFEPASAITNPNRCDPKLYGACYDPWGTSSNRPYGKGQTVQQSPELRQVMTEAKTDPAFRNYFLTGVQTQFVDNNGKPLALGNSFVEFNQGVAPGKSSCMTCHQYASFDGKQVAHGAPEHNFGRPPVGWPSTGYACNQNQTANCLPSDSVATSQDFSWMLGAMPYEQPPAQQRLESLQQTANTR